MLGVHSLDQINRLAHTERALVAVFIHHCYDWQLLDQMLGAKHGFDRHVRDAWHLLVPSKVGPGGTSGFIDGIPPNHRFYDSELAYEIARTTGIKGFEMPCLLFLENAEESFYCSLAPSASFDPMQLIREIGDEAIKCQRESKQEGEAYRSYVNTVVKAHLARKRIAKFVKHSGPWLDRLIQVLGLPG